MTEPLVLSADQYKYWQIDFQNGTIKMVGQDGQIVEEELDPRFRSRDSQVATSTFDWERWWILSTTTRGDLIITEGFNPNSAPPFNGRSAVYLDQNHWRTVSDVLHDPSRVENPKVSSAGFDGGMELPLSRLLGEGGASVRGLVLDGRDEPDLAVEPFGS